MLMCKPRREKQHKHVDVVFVNRFLLWCWKNIKEKQNDGKIVDVTPDGDFPMAFTAVNLDALQADVLNVAGNDLPVCCSNLFFKICC